MTNAENEEALLVHAHRRGAQRQRYVHPIRARTRADGIRGSFEFRIDAPSTHGDNVIVMGLFNAGEADDASSLTLQVWDMSTVRVQLTSRGSTATLEPVLTDPLVAGRSYRFEYEYDPDRSVFRARMRTASQAGPAIFQLSAPTRSLGDFSVDELGVSLWNVGDVTTPRSTAWAYRLLGATLAAP